MTGTIVVVLANLKWGRAVFSGWRRGVTTKSTNHKSTGLLLFTYRLVQNALSWRSVDLTLPRWFDAHGSIFYSWPQWLRVALKHPIVFSTCKLVFYKPTFIITLHYPQSVVSLSSSNSISIWIGTFMSAVQKCRFFFNTSHISCKFSVRQKTFFSKLLAAYETATISHSLCVKTQ